MQATSFLILGAGGGIGSATARILAKQGARVLLAGRDSDSLNQLAAEIGGVPHTVDGRSFEDVAAAAERAKSEFGRLDGIANCVGSLLLKPAHITTEDEFDETIATNLRSAFAAVRAGAKTMRDGGGSIVLVSSAATQVGLANHEAIAAAKGGVSGLTLAAAASYAKSRIRVNAVAPGLVKTRLTERLTANDKGEEASLAMHALGRLGQPEDVAAAIAFLLDPSNDWITGQILGVDGGLGAVRPRS